MASLASKVERHLIGCLPPGVPPSFLTIVDARLIQRGRSETIQADLIMFDGRPAVVAVFRAGQTHSIPIWRHRWLDLPGGSVSFEGGQWIRIDPETLEPFPEQADLFAATASPLTPGQSDDR